MRILLVEDHTDTLAVFSRLLRRRDHVVRTAATCAEALSWCASETFDLLICDIRLPDGNGVDLVRQLRETPSCDVPAIGLTGDPQPGEAEVGLDAGFVEYLIKPVHFDRLDEAIQRATERRP